LFCFRTDETTYDTICPDVNCGGVCFCKSQYLKTSPTYILLIVNRFSSSGAKINSPIENFMTVSFPTNDQNLLIEYELHSFIVHKGLDVDQGHYMSGIYNNLNSYFIVNDDKNEQSDYNLEVNNAYILIYCLKNHVNDRNINNVPTTDLINSVFNTRKRKLITVEPCNETEFVFDSHIFELNENNYVKCAFCSTYFQNIIIHLVRSSKCKQHITNFSLFKLRLKESKLVVKKKKKLITVEPAEFLFDSHIFELNENNYVKCAFCSKYFQNIIIHLVRSSKCKQHITNLSSFKLRLKEFLGLKTKHGKRKLVVKEKGKKKKKS
jgi:uncharacterized Zn-finger protein